jgi:hypothetical protein
MSGEIEPVETFFDLQGPPEVVELLSKIAAGALIIWLSSSELWAELKKYRDLHKATARS